MCGIVGYVGKNQAYPFLVKGLKRLEYRGYDSAGIALCQAGRDRLTCIKSAGRISDMEKLAKGKDVSGNIGIAHTRWATHGVPNKINAHPHLDTAEELAVVHNGIIENYRTLKRYLEKEGVVFCSDTDTEVLAHLFSRHYKGDLVKAVQSGLSLVEGTYGIAVIHLDKKDEIVVARKGSPLVVGFGNKESIVASDPAAVIDHTKKVLYVEDGEIALVRPSSFKTFKRNTVSVAKRLQHIEWDLNEIEKKGYHHFMLKEIFEQPDSLKDTLRGRIGSKNGRIRLGGLYGHLNRLSKIKRVILIGCGTAWHAALIGKYMFEDIAGIPAEAEYASEFRYRNPVVEKDTLAIIVSQSGETADTLEALRKAKAEGAIALGVVNVVGSTIARETDMGVYLHAGPEIGVASTKAFTSQLVVLYMIALLFAYQRNRMSSDEFRKMLAALQEIPAQVSKTLELDSEIKKVAALYKKSADWLYLGRVYNFPVALEGALKMKEISYVHAEGLPAAEMKHGPIALINPGMPVVFLANKGIRYSKVLGNIEEVKTRGGNVICIASKGNTEIQKITRHTFFVPDVSEPLQPIINVIVLQLLAYHVATMRGCPVDKPRNLAKSVTVE